MIDDIFTAGQLKRIESWLSQFSAKCPTCGGAAFDIPTHVYKLNARTGYTPAAAAICKGCRQISLFAADLILDEA